MLNCSLVFLPLSPLVYHETLDKRDCAVLFDFFLFFPLRETGLVVLGTCLLLSIN